MHKGEGEPKWRVYILKNPLVALLTIVALGAYFVSKIMDSIV
jgi:hypothetical protein